jgi:hypothetical protein
MPFPVVPDWCEFMQCCAGFRKNLEEEVSHGRCSKDGSIRDSHNG